MLATQNVRVKPNSDTIKDVNKKKQSKIKKYQWDFATVKRETLKSVIRSTIWDKKKPTQFWYIARAK